MYVCVCMCTYRGARNSSSTHVIYIRCNTKPLLKNTCAVMPMNNITCAVLSKQSVSNSCYYQNCLDLVETNH